MVGEGMTITARMLRGNPGESVKMLPRGSHPANIRSLYRYANSTDFKSLDSGLGGCRRPR